MTEDLVILVDKTDKEVGTMPKMEAHVEGKLHRAFSVFIFNWAGELLLQQRAAEKYHSASKWTNSCCSHPRPGENNIDAAKRRLKEEMGLTCELNPVFSFCYKSEVENDLTEHEYDHVYFGSSNDVPTPDPTEVADYSYVSMEDLEVDLMQHPEKYTTWLKICFKEIMVHYKNLNVYG